MMQKLIELWNRFADWYFGVCEPDEYYESVEEEDWWRMQW